MMVAVFVQCGINIPFVNLQVNHKNPKIVKTPVKFFPTKFWFWEHKRVILS